MARRYSGSLTIYIRIKTDENYVYDVNITCSDQKTHQHQHRSWEAYIDASPEDQRTLAEDSSAIFDEIARTAISFMDCSEDTDMGVECCCISTEDRWHVARKKENRWNPPE